ncbi:hypothetical protein NQ318_013175 [Aromia moschata]|uniref:Helix-turn-helix domain-containing protein n=1 Tax=Aromia moschata TaxID=1265417 RepID=A0AAV8Y5P3_9CUCU|nr:hypothetical protein NQ318_013175 [Aromia moschata]
MSETISIQFHYLRLKCGPLDHPEDLRGGTHSLVRYVDDIFAVFDTKTINFVAKLNNRFPTIKFTYEVEHNEWLPFLDVLVIKNSENKKETATLRYIPNDSHHPFQHKRASFNFLIHRLLNFTLSKERFEHEKQLIKNIAKSNGYSVHLIDKLIRKHKFKRTLYNSTAFRRDTDNSKFASLPYEPKFTRGLDKIFKNININLVYNSKNKLQTLLGNPKDKINNNEKSGIYEISCKDCDQKNITNIRQLDAFESLEIIKCNSSMNKDNGPISTSPLFALINKDSYGSVNRGNKFSINSAMTTQIRGHGVISHHLGRHSWSTFKLMNLSLKKRTTYENAEILVNNVLRAYKEMGCRLSLKIFLLDQSTLESCAMNRMNGSTRM